MKITSLLWLLCLLFACNTTQHKEKAFSVAVTKRVSPFHKPVIIQPAVKESVAFLQRRSLEHSYNMFMGRSAFNDTLFIPLVDTTNIDYSHNRVSDWQWSVDPDTLNFTGLEVVPDYNTNILKLRNANKRIEPIAFYPVYLVNPTGTVRNFAGKDSYTYAIQEAMDKKGRWYPIEAKPFDFCGNGTWLLSIKPGEFVSILFPKYEGSFKTKLRVRIRNHQSIYVSSPYEGTINERQFYLKKDSPVYAELHDDKKGIIQSFFFGSPPLGWD